MRVKLVRLSLILTWLSPTVPEGRLWQGLFRNDESPHMLAPDMLVYGLQIYIKLMPRKSFKNYTRGKSSWRIGI